MPLANRTIVVTRPEHQAEDMLSALRNLGAEPLFIPAIEIQPIADLAPLDKSLSNLAEYRWLIFTSANGVRIAMDRARQLGVDWQRLSNLRLATIGPATADVLAEHGLEAEFVPESFVAEEVAAGLPEVAGGRILLPRAKGARDVLPKRLEARGATVDEIHIYQSVQAEPDPQAIDRLESGVDAITFTSPSTATNFTAILTGSGFDPLHLPNQPLIACIGPITAQAAQDLGYHVELVAEEFTSDGLVEALAAHFREPR